LVVDVRGEDSVGRRVPLWGGISGRDLVLFTRELADLLESNVPLIRALKVVQKQTGNRRLGSVVASVVSFVEGGSSFSEALRRFPEVFPPLYGSLARAGEVGGMLGTTLGRLAEFLEQEEELKSRLMAAAAYPSLIAVVGAGTVVFLMTFVVPKLAGMFVDTGQPLPYMTRALMAASSFILGPGGLCVVGGAIVAGFGFRRERVRRVLIQTARRAVVRIPLWGQVLKRVAVARFARTLSALLAGGVPIVDALNVTADVMGHAVMREQVLRAAILVREGMSLSESLKRMPDFPLFIRNMISVGEEGNTLEKSLQKAAATYEREADRAMKLATSLMEPLMILVVGSVIGGIVVSLLLPIFQMPTFVK
jgi:type II secretory pathway component PulF